MAHRRLPYAPLVLLATLVAGCTGDPGVAATDPLASRPLASPGALLADLASSDCDYNDMIWLMPLADVQAQLPDGFQARTMVLPGHGAIVINAFDCREGFGWNGWDMFAIVEPPALPDTVEAFNAANRSARGTGEHYELDLYMLAAHTDHEGLAAIFDQAGIPRGNGSHARMPATLAGRVATAYGELEAGGQVLASYTEVTARAEPALGGQLSAHHRQWRIDAHGLTLVERIMTRAGGEVDLAQGAASCEIGRDTHFFGIVGQRSCHLGQDAIGGMQWTGAAYRFEGIFPRA